MIHIALSDYTIESVTAVSAINARTDERVATWDGISTNWMYAGSSTAESATAVVARDDPGPRGYPGYIDTPTIRLERVIYESEFETLMKRVVDLEELVKNLWQAKSVGDLL